MCKQYNYDMIGRIIYYILNFIISFNNFFYNLGTYFREYFKIKINPLYFPISNNPIYSFFRGLNTYSENLKINILNEKKDIINIIAVGDTHSDLSKYLSLTKFDYLIQLGDLCYDNDKQLLINNLDTKKCILVPGCREFLGYFNINKSLWNKNFIKKFYPNFYNIKIIKTGNVKIKLLTIHNYFFLCCKEYYDIVNFLDQSYLIDADYTILLSHCPPYSVSRHGPDYIIRSILNLSKIKNKVDLFLSGHEHCYMRFDINNTPFIVNGLGGHSRYSFYTKDINLKKKYNNNQYFLYLNIFKKHIIFKLKNFKGVEIDKVIIENKT